jgi:hypothetical protein
VGQDHRYRRAAAVVGPRFVQDLDLDFAFKALDLAQDLVVWR